ncbi:hypothetical protein [Pseudobutyrivibrio xylanivorans]|uniref:Uncharacterized protein n=1 Tax=Pseudobutyrivibrio xylanivorans DSM 14809 TaxID=1123012 RepID=A0A1M6JUZ7_PSEXY|nr:hypothetical protein [Pseudobutyrivibrio xylanivorans]SHJ50518.1 hypothetical protein SAMN02745725_02691 [Pseudobutyrivibrio xylanivorans DSM 14809]
MICSDCGKDFNYEIEEEKFTSENSSLSYKNFDRDYCAACALKVAENPGYGDYHEECEECGKRFDLAEERDTYKKYIIKADDRLEHQWWNTRKILCGSCAIGFEM